MPAVVNTAAKYYPQHNLPALGVDGTGATTTTIAPLPCTIVKVLTGGSRVNVAVENPAQTKQTPQGAFSMTNVPFVDTGEAPPATGPFVTATGYAVPVDGTSHLPNGTPSSSEGESNAGA
ncbi:hypothetical protein [Burkholderia phage FLC9]|nr:hypothetical protein [Burkholderia phage FLC9]